MKLILQLAMSSLFVFSCASEQPRHVAKRPAPQKISHKKGDRKVLVASNVTEAPDEIKLKKAVPAEAPVVTEQAPPAKVGNPRIDALKTEYSKRPEVTDNIRNQISNLPEQDLETLVLDEDMPGLKAQALFEKSHRYEGKGDFESSIRSLEDIIRLVPGSVQSEQAQNKIRELKTMEKVEWNTYAALLPMTGKNATQGQKALRALQMGLGISGDDSSGIKLKVIDTESSGIISESAFQKAVFDEHPIAVVGPIVSKTAIAVATECQNYKVPCMSLSQNAHVTEGRDYVFSHSLNSQVMAKFLVDKAFEKGQKKFAIMYPDDFYGIDYANAFWDEVLRHGGQVTAAQAYESSETDFRYVAQRLVSSFYIEARKEEFTLLMKDQKDKVSLRQNLSADDLLPPLIDFDAVFIPDSAKAMGQVSAFLSYVGVKKVDIIGTNLWNVPGLAKRAHQFKDSVVFADMYNPANPSNESVPFFKTYFEKYAEYPGPLEVHAYEAGLILRQAYLKRIISRSGMQSYLASVRSFPGVFGELNMTEDRHLSRPLSLFKIEKDDVTIVQ